MENDLSARVGKLEDAMIDLKRAVLGYWDGNTRVPGALESIQNQNNTLATLLNEVKKRDEAHAQLVKAAWALVRPVIAGVIAVIFLQIVGIVARAGLPGVHIP